MHQDQRGEIIKRQGAEGALRINDVRHRNAMKHFIAFARPPVLLLRTLCALVVSRDMSLSCGRADPKRDRSCMFGRSLIVALLLPLVAFGWAAAERWGQTAVADTRESSTGHAKEIGRTVRPEDAKAVSIADEDNGTSIRAATSYGVTGADQNQLVRVGVLANRGKAICLTEWAPTANYLSAQLSPRRFEIVPLDFGEVRNAVEQRGVEFLLVNSSMYVALEYDGLVYRIATFQQPAIKGEGPLPVFGGVIFCRADRNDILELRDLAGKRFGAVEQSSFGGWQAAWREFEQLGIHPLKDFAVLVFAGTHDAVVEAVRSGQVDAGTVRSTQLERMALEGAIDLREFRVLKGASDPSSDYPFLLSTRIYPEWPFAAVKGTDLELGKLVASALLRMSGDDPAARASRGAGWAIPQDYASLHECLRELRLAPYEDYGKVTILQAIVQHWAYVLGILAVMVIILALGFSAFRTSARLKDSFAALRQSEREYRSIIENIQDVFYRVDAEGRIVLISPSAVRLLGYDSVDDLIRQSADVLWADPEKRSALLDRLARFGQVDDWELQVKRRDGSLLQAAASLRTICDEHGTSLGYEGIWRDISERKRAEEKAERLNRQVKMILDSAGEGIFGLDSEGNHTFVNPAAARMLGYEAEELNHRNSHAIWHYARSDGTPYPERECPVYTTLRDGLIHQGEEYFLRKDGSGLSVEFTSTPIQELGKFVGAVVTFRDITERKQVEEALQLSKAELQEINRELEDSIRCANEMAIQAEQSNAAKSEFLANMSHEIRTPMNGVIGMTGLLLDTDLTSEQREYLEIVHRSGEALLSLINDILDFSKIEAGKLEVETLDFDLRTTLEDTAEILAARAHEKGLELVCLVDPGVPALLRGDPGRLRQIIVNLAGNGLKFTHKGEVSIRASLDSEDERSATVRFSVTDTGIGIPRDRMSILFSPFTQVDGSTTRKFGGTGLGLAISKQLAELMGGSIGVESLEGRGSTFWFTTVFQKQPEGHDEAAESLAGIEGIKVLVVDDNATNRFLATTLLRSWGCRFEEAADAVTALAKLQDAARRGDPFEIALIDMLMPEVDGAELGRKIKASAELDRTRLVMMTSVGKRGDAAYFERIGFSGYLSKPVRQSQFRECLALVMSRKGPSGHEPPRGIITRHTVAEAVKRRLRILLVEDNITNQQVALAILKKLGYRADAVANGLEAIEALRRIPYDLVLMDCQMPEMDGYEATRRIRNAEKIMMNDGKIMMNDECGMMNERDTEEGRYHSSFITHHSSFHSSSPIPIIAMTAHAMKGDREKCIQAGMSDYIAKPIEPVELADVLERWLPRTVQGASSAPVQAERGRATAEVLEVSGCDIFDGQTLRRRLMGDEDLAKTIIEAFLKDIPNQIDALRSSIEKKDARQAEQLAHKIKGASGNVAAMALQKVAYKMEQAAQTHDMEQLKNGMDGLCRQFALLKEAMTKVE